MAGINRLQSLLENNPPASNFRPYVEIHVEADALSAQFKPDPDYSKRLTDHVTLFLSIETNEIVGCRIKGIRGILEDLPNYIEIKHGSIELSVIFWSFRGGATDDEAKAFKELAKKSDGLTIEPATVT
jgi:hypothetical protein